MVKYLKNWDTLVSLKKNLSETLKMAILLSLDECKTAKCVVINFNPDQKLYSAASDLGLHCLLRFVCLNTWGKYGTFDQYITLHAG